MQSKTHKFTRNIDGKEVFVVIAKIKSVERDDFSECTKISLIDGTHEGVRETVGQVRKIIDDAQRT
jgi:hypothetical protein